MGCDVLILGGDQRNKIALDLLKDQGRKVEYFSNEYRESQDAILDCVANTRCILLPTSVNEEEICHLSREQILKNCRSGTYLFCGTASKLWKLDAEQKKVDMVEFLNNETFAAENAYYTAEGAIVLAQEKRKSSMWFSRCVVVGSGRIAKALCRMLKVHTPLVSVVARNPKIMAELSIEQIRCYSVSQQASAFSRTDVVFNTVPDNILNPAALKEMNPLGLYVELASAPFGLSPENFPKSIERIAGNGIPGRYFPNSAARSMVKAMTPYL